MIRHGRGHPVYRVEWRETADVGDEPSFSSWRCAPGGAEARTLALALSSSGIVHRDEFHMAIVAQGKPVMRLFTDAASIAAWDPTAKPLPGGVTGGTWTSDLERRDAGIDMLETVRAATARAVKAGSIGRARARRLIAEMRTALDDEDEEPEGTV